MIFKTLFHRFNKNVNNKIFFMCRHKLVTMLLDARTLGASYLTNFQQKAISLLKLACLEFLTTHREFLSEK